MFQRARLRLAFAFAGTLVLAVAIIGLAAYVALRSSLDRDINRSLESAHASLLASGASALVTGATPVATARSDRDRDEDEDDEDHGHGEEARTPASLVSTEVFYVVTDRRGTVLANPREANLEGIDFAALAGGASGERRMTDSAASEHFRFLSGPLGANGTVLHTGRSLASRDDQLRTLAAVFVGGALAAVGAAAAGGWWLSGRALVPIRQAVESQRRFVSDASHELRTPITIIQANAELVLRHTDATVEDNLEYLEAVSSATHQLGSLVRDLLTLARADEGRLELDLVAMDLGRVVAEVARDLGAVAAGREVRLECASVSTWVRGDPQRMRQVVAILADNAIKFTPSGGTVTISCRPAGRGVEVAVTDTGPGIDAEHLLHVFDRFYRADRARGSDGTGLGLAIARSLVEAQGGRLTAESDGSAGTTFRFRLSASAPGDPPGSS